MTGHRDKSERQEIGDRRWETGEGGETRDMRWEKRDGRKEMVDRRWEIRDGRQEMCASQAILTRLTTFNFFLVS